MSWGVIKQILSLRFMAIILGVSLLGACASTPEVSANLTPEEQAEEQTIEAERLQLNDPLEGINRITFDLNMALDVFILRPVAFTYKEIMPQSGQNRVIDFLNNLRSPVVFVNDILQGDVDAAARTFARFMMNSTIGLLGLADVAEEAGLPYHDNDFGITLASWGVDEGPYLVLPIIGPSSIRNAVGLGVDLAFDPMTWASFDNHLAWDMTRYSTRIVSLRAQYYDAFDEVERDSLDFYATMRSLYRQTRAATVDKKNERFSPNNQINVLKAETLDVKVDVETEVDALDVEAEVEVETLGVEFK